MERLKEFFKIFVETGETVEKCLEDGDWDLLADTFATGKKLAALIPFLSGGLPDFSLLEEDDNRNEMKEYLKEELDLANDNLEEIIEDGIDLIDTYVDAVQQSISFFNKIKASKVTPDPE